MLKLFAAFLFSAFLPGNIGAAQNNTATAPAKPTEHLIGTVTAVDANARTITVKEDKSGNENTILLSDTKTLLKVPPDARDLKSATRITAADLAIGDRVDIRGSKAEDAQQKIIARSLVLMSGRDLQQAHEEQAAEWKRSTPGVVTAVDSVSGKITANVRTPEGPKPTNIQTSSTTEFTRYSPSAPGTPAASRLTEIQPGDHVRVIGEKGTDGTTINAQRVYSGAFRTVNGTVVSIGDNGKSITIKDLASKKPIEVDLTETSTVHKLPPMLAMGLARRLNPGLKPPNGSSAGNGAGNSPENSPTTGNRWQRTAPGEASLSGPPEGGASPNGPAGPAGSGPKGMRAMSNGDISQMIERLPKIEVSELKPGDAVIVSGVATGTDSARLFATVVIAGVEPILQAAPARQGGQALGGDWGLGEMAIPQ